MKFESKKNKEVKKMLLPSVEEQLLKYQVDPVEGLLRILSSDKISEQKRADILMALLPYYHPKPKVEIGYARNPSESNPLVNLSAGDLMELLRNVNDDAKPVTG